MAAEISEISSPPGDTYTFLDLPDAIEALQNGDDIDYDGAAGALDINEDGDATSGVYDTYTFRNGTPEVTGEVPVAGAGDETDEETSE